MRLKRRDVMELGGSNRFRHGGTCLEHELITAHVSALAGMRSRSVRVVWSEASSPVQARLSVQAHTRSVLLSSEQRTD